MASGHLCLPKGLVAPEVFEDGPCIKPVHCLDIINTKYLVRGNDLPQFGKT